jgi:N-acetyl-gamma-glutamyl-phosphate reductase
MELVRILARHPHVKIGFLTTRDDQKMQAGALVRGLGKSDKHTIEKRSFAEVVRGSDVVFLALPHTTAMDSAAAALAKRKVVIDLSADFRLKNARSFEIWYEARHSQKTLLKHAVYGLPEMYRDQIRTADLIANPGCYPTGAILGLYPLLKERLIERDSIVIDAKSGVSGAGKKLAVATHFVETNENFSAYKVNRHQHMPEIAQALADAAGWDVDFTFVPHLLPLSRGLLSTIYVKRTVGVKAARIVRAFEDCYREEPFVRFRGEGVFPSVRDVQHTNFCDVGIQASQASDRVIIVSAIDNLLKGASGQAVQNMNIRLGFSEQAGLLS